MAVNEETARPQKDPALVRKVNVFKSIYPIFMGFSADLLFWIAIDTLFLSIVKGLEASQIVFLTDFGLIASLVLYFPMQALIRTLGSTRSLRIGVLMSVAAAVLLTFARSYALLLFAMTVKHSALWLYGMQSIILKNNLNAVGCGGEFAKYQTRGYTAYSVLTAAISFIAAPLFNLWHMLPMLCCIACTLVAFGLSFFIRDYSAPEPTAAVQAQTVRPDLKKLFLFIFAYGLTYSLFASSQAEGKLFIQQTFFEFLSEKEVVSLVGLMVSISRLVRIAANVVSYRIYVRWKEKVYPAFAALLLFSMLTITLSSFLPAGKAKIAVMIFGYVVILFLRDPYKVFIHDLVLSLCRAEEQKKVILLLQFSNQILYAALLLGFSQILVSHPMLTVMYIFIGLSALVVVINLLVALRGRRLLAEKAAGNAG